ncbi:MAG: TonB family protein [Rhodothalassiaceae bacterium]
MRTLILLGLMAFSAAAAAQDPFQDAFTAYQEAFQHGDRYRALDLAEQLYALSRDRSEAVQGAMAYNLGIMYSTTGQPAKAAKPLQEAATRFEAMGAAAAVQAADAYWYLGQAHDRLDEQSKRLKALRQAEKLIERHAPDERAKLAEIGLDVAQAQFARGRHQRALSKIKDVRGAYAEPLPKVLRIQAHYTAALAHLAQREEEEALPLLEQAMALFSKEEAQASVFASRIAMHLAYARLAQHRARPGQDEPLGDLLWQGIPDTAITDSCACDHLDDGAVKPLDKAPPRYPDAMARASIEGMVLVEYMVNENGRTDNVRVVEAVPYSQEFIDAAVRSAQQFVYAVPTQSGKPTTVSHVRNLFTFALADR